MSDDALGAQKIQQQRSTKDAAAEKAANITTTRNPKPEGDTLGDHPRGKARIWDGHHVTNRNLRVGSGIRVRQARISTAKQTRVSSLLASQGPQIFLVFFFFLLAFFVLFRFSSLFFPFLYLPFFFFSPIDLRLSCVCVVIDTTCNIYVVVFLGWQSEYLVSPGVSSETYAPAWTWHIVD